MEEQISNINFCCVCAYFFVILLVAEFSGKTFVGYLLLIWLVFSFGRVFYAVCAAFHDYNPFFRITGISDIGLALVAIAIHLLFNAHANNALNLTFRSKTSLL